MDRPDLLDAFGCTRPAWMRDALCREYPHVSFFPEKGEGAGPALQVCGRCLVMLDCRAWAIADPSLDHGVLGGMTAQTRKAARKLAAQRGGPPTPHPDEAQRTAPLSRSVCDSPSFGREAS